MATAAEAEGAAGGRCRYPGVGSGPAGLGRTEVTEAGGMPAGRPLGGHCSATLFAFGGRVAATPRAAASSSASVEQAEECSMLTASPSLAALAACLVCGVLAASASVAAAPAPADDATSTAPPLVATTTATSSSSSGAGAARSLAARPGPLAQAAQALAPLGHLVKEAPDRVKETLRKGADGLRGRIHGGLSRITGGTESTTEVGLAPGFLSTRAWNKGVSTSDPPTKAYSLSIYMAHTPLLAGRMQMPLQQAHVTRPSAYFCRPISVTGSSLIRELVPLVPLAEADRRPPLPPVVGTWLWRRGASAGSPSPACLTVWPSSTTGWP